MITCILVSNPKLTLCLAVLLPKVSTVFFGLLLKKLSINNNCELNFQGRCVADLILMIGTSRILSFAKIMEG